MFADGISAVLRRQEKKKKTFITVSINGSNTLLTKWLSCKTRSARKEMWWNFSFQTKKKQWQTLQGWWWGYDCTELLKKVKRMKQELNLVRLRKKDINSVWKVETAYSILLQHHLIILFVGFLCSEEDREPVKPQNLLVLQKFAITFPPLFHYKNLFFFVESKPSSLIEKVRYK